MRSIHLLRQRECTLRKNRAMGIEEGETPQRHSQAAVQWGFFYKGKNGQGKEAFHNQQKE